MHRSQNGVNPEISFKIIQFFDTTSGSYEKTVNLSLSEPRMESVSNNSVKNTVISARSCLVESLRTQNYYYHRTGNIEIVRPTP